MPPGIHLRPRRAFLNPLTQRRHFPVGQSGALGRHHVVRVGGRDALEQFARLRLARDQRAFARFAGQDRRRTRIKTEVGFLFVRTVALRAAFDQDRLDVAIEVNGGTGQGGCPGEQEREQSGAKEAGGT